MIFNSFEFIFVFLPIVFVIYFLLNRINFSLSKGWLLLASLFFYSWWNPKYLPLILASLLVNYAVGTYLGKTGAIWKRKSALTLGIIFNVFLLGYFKYYDFFVTNLNSVIGTNFTIQNLVLPLAISFYTFQQIAYLVDSYRQETKEYNFLNFGLFVTFFPQLIAGPIIHHSDVMSQFEDSQNKKLNYKNIGLGLFVFAVGLFKKVGIADTFAVWANKGYAMSEKLTFIDSWITSLSYTLQLYFDFSGYSDMAIGAALLFNISIQKNFNSPYKALSIQDFWRRWHITLSNFLTSYIYIPLGGNRKGAVLTYINIMIVFLVSGFWHGAGWTFVVWGLLHGLASVVNRFWSRAGFKMNKLLAWFITFQFVNATWVFFRAPSFEIAQNVLKGMVGMNGFSLPEEFKNYSFFNGLTDFYVFPFGESITQTVGLILAGLLIVFLAKNSLELKESLKPNWTYAIYTSILIIYSVFQLQKVSEFLYFNF